MTVQLSDPKDYEGGEFCFIMDIKILWKPECKEQGSILVFDSRM